MSSAKWRPFCLSLNESLSPTAKLQPFQSGCVTAVVFLTFSSEPNDCMHDMLSWWFIVLGELVPNHMWFPLTVSLFDNPFLIHSSIITHLLAHYENSTLWSRCFVREGNYHYLKMPHGYIQFWILGDFYLIHNSDFVLFACVGNVKVDTWLEFLS